MIGAPVINLASVRQRGADRLCDGRRKGNHGNRASQAMKTAVIARLNELLDLRGVVTADDKQACAQSAGVDVRTVNRWWARECENKLAALRAPTGSGSDTDNAGGRATGHVGGCVAGCKNGTHARGCRAGLDLSGLQSWLYKFNELERLQLTPDEIAFFASHTRIIDANQAVRADPHSRLRHYAVPTLYAAYANVAESVRVGARRGAAKQRSIEATYPLTGRETLNETWSIDEYDLKLSANYQGVPVEPKVLIVRERHSGLPLSMVVLPRAATGADTYPPTPGHPLVF